MTGNLRHRYDEACAELAALLLRRPLLHSQLEPYLTADDLPEQWRAIWEVTGQPDLAAITGRGRVSVLAERLGEDTWRVRELTRAAPAYPDIPGIVATIVEARSARKLAEALRPVLAWLAADDGIDE